MQPEKYLARAIQNIEGARANIDPTEHRDARSLLDSLAFIVGQIEKIQNRLKMDAGASVQCAEGLGVCEAPT